MSKPKAWLSAFRLRTLPLAFSTILVGNALAFQSIHWNTSVFILTLLTTLFLQILSNLANDYGDFIKGTDNENRIGPERSLQSGALSIKEMRKGIATLILLSFLTGIYLLYLVSLEFGSTVFWVFFILGLISIAAALFYTIGKKAYGYNGFGDVFVFLFFGWLGVGGSYYLQTGEFYGLILLPATGIGCFASAVLNLNNMRDRSNDANSNKRTLVVLFGQAFAKVYHFVLLATGMLSLLLFSFLTYDSWINFIYVPGFLVFIIHLVRVIKTTKEKEFDPELKKVALGTFLIAILFFLSTINNLC